MRTGPFTRRFALLTTILSAVLLSASLPRLDTAAIFATLPFMAAPGVEAIELPVEAGGEAIASELSLGSDCRGYITGDAPSVRIDLQQSGATGVILELQSNAQNALIINASDGRWYCARSNGQHRSRVELPNPNTGQMDIWTASFSEALLPSTLRVQVIDALTP